MAIPGIKRSNARRAANCGMDKLPFVVEPERDDDQALVTLCARGGGIALIALDLIKHTACQVVRAFAWPRSVNRLFEQRHRSRLEAITCGAEADLAAQRQLLWQEAAFSGMLRVDRRKFSTR
ncbi:MAG: hypothetical protein R3D44_08135 [Hyphomicrobiaceae bacterium]